MESPSEVMRMVLAVMSQRWDVLWMTGSDEDGPVCAHAAITGVTSDPIIYDRGFRSHQAAATGGVKMAKVVSSIYIKCQVF